MPKVDPTAYLMDALSTLTGGLISDVQTLMLGGVLVTFLLMGFDYLFDILNHSIAATHADRYLKDAKNVLMARNTWKEGTAEYDHHNALYRKLIRRSADLRAKGWRHDT